VLIAACAGAAGVSTTVTSEPTMGTTSTSTSVEISTTAAAVETTTSVTVEGRLDDPLSIAYPDDPRTIDDLPDLLTDLVGAPMPEPNLMLDSEADFERWLHEWINWYTWLAANPTDDPDVLAVGFVPDTDEFERQIGFSRQEVEKGHRTLGWWARVQSINPLGSDSMFDQRVAGVIGFEATQPYPVYAIDNDGVVVATVESPEVFPIAMTVRNGEEVGWRVEFLTFG